jgi:glucose/arabinose dehydrogenase
MWFITLAKSDSHQGDKMSDRVRKGCVIPAVLILVSLICGSVFLYFGLRQAGINIQGFIGSGGEAAVDVPAGFEVNIFAEGLNGPRFMAVGPDGVLYVADRANDRVVALPDADGDGVADTIQVFASGLDNPHSIVYHEGRWYVGVTTGVMELVDVDGDMVSDQRNFLVETLPVGGQHSTRTVEFLPDGRMVVSVGSSCNVCEEEDPRRAAIVIYDAAPPAGERVLASGLRNAVGLAIHPETGELWASNNGRDLMGDDLPPENIYIIADGADYGWPTCHSGDIIDPDMGQEGDCDGVASPVVEMQAHSAPLGLTFYTGEMFPPEYRDDLFIAFHGSWNRSVPTGYKIVRLPFENGVPGDVVVDFASGWLQADGSSSGRPVDVTVGSDGALYVSDDKGGFIYRISYTGE